MPIRFDLQYIENPVIEKRVYYKMLHEKSRRLVLVFLQYSEVLDFGSESSGYKSLISQRLNSLRRAVKILKQCSVNTITMFVGWLVLSLTALWDSISVYIGPSLPKRERYKKERIAENKNAQTTPTAPTASAVGPCPTVIQIVGRPGSGSVPGTIAPTDHPSVKMTDSKHMHILTVYGILLTVYC